MEKRYIENIGCHDCLECFSNPQNVERFKCFNGDGPDPSDVSEYVEANTSHPDCPLPKLTVVEGCEKCPIEEYCRYAGYPNLCEVRGMTVQFPPEGK